MAKQLSVTLGLVHIELDALHHLADWQTRPADEFVSKVAEAMDAAPNGWVMCGGYGRIVGRKRLEHADTLIWLDPPRAVVMRQITWRTLRRVLTREKLWNGNREPFTNLYRWDPDKNVIRWAWTRFDQRRAGYEESMETGEWDHLTVHRLRTRQEVKQFLAAL